VIPNIGPLELIVVLVIALVVLGPKRLPDAGRSLGRGLREFKGALANDAHDEPEPVVVTEDSATRPQ
jgi:sec-independent protein translocase protein TatA